MLNSRTYNDLLWVNVTSPTKQEAKELSERFDIHPLVVEELLFPTRKPKVDLYRDYVYLVLHFPAIEHTHTNEVQQEVDFIVGKNFVITVHYDNIDALEKFDVEFETNSILETSPIGNHAGHLFYFIIKKLYKACAHELEYIESELETIEDDIFEGKEREMVEVLSIKSRNLIDFKKAIIYHEDVLHSFATICTTFFDKNFLFYTDHIQREYRRIYNQFLGLQALLTELRETNNSLLTTKQNETIKIFTAVAFLTLPLSVIAGIFGMNAKHMPIIGHINDFWWIIILMVGIAIFTFAFFKYKKWL